MDSQKRIELLEEKVKELEKQFAEIFKITLAEPEIIKKLKTKYADYVTMTKEEYERLMTKHGAVNTKGMIDILSNYKGANGKRYKSDYLAILNWVKDKWYSLGI